MNNISIKRELEVIENEIYIYMSQATESLLQVGIRLHEVKEQLKHGEWSQWLGKMNLNERTANNYIRVANRFKDSQIGIRIPFSKLQVLIDIPKEQEEKFIADNDIENKSVRQIKKNMKQN